MLITKIVDKNSLAKSKTFVFTINIQDLKAEFHHKKFTEAFALIQAFPAIRLLILSKPDVKVPLWIKPML